MLPAGTHVVVGGTCLDAQSNPLDWPAWAWRPLMALALVMAAFSVAGSGSNVARSTGLLRDMGNLGMRLERTAQTPWGWSEVAAVVPGGAAAKAGVVPGDRVRFGGLFGYSIGQGPPPTRPATPAQLTIDRDGSRFHRAVAYPPGPPFPGTEPLIALNAMTALVMTVFGALVLIRGRRSRAAVMLGMVMLYLALAAARLPAWSPNILLAQARVVTIILSVAAMGWFWPQFCLEISGGAGTSRQSRLVKAGALVLMTLGVVAAILSRLPLAPSIAGAAQASWLTFLAGGQLFGFAIIAGNYRRNDPPARNRIQIVAVAFVCYLLSQALNLTTSLMLDAGYPPIQGFWFGIGAAGMSFVGLGLLVYAVLGQRLFDIGFALNRSLVYGAVSFILLATFGLAEWGAERLLPEAWHEGGVLFSAGIALALFLSFHRLRDWVERHVEKVLFSSWHRNEAALRRFAASAAHFEQAPALCRAFAEEVTRFAQGAGAALYLRAGGPGYKRCAGKLAGARASYPGDDRAFALMRAERRPLDLAEAHSALPGVLALPMLDQGALAGFVLLGRKPDGTDYRPDEVEALGWATEQVGFALQAQHVHDLEARIAGLDAQLASLSGGTVRLSAVR
jgi:hypothetical protein